MEAAFRRINQTNYLKCKPLKELSQFLYKNCTIMELYLWFTRGPGNVRSVKGKVAKMSNNVLRVKVKELLQKWYKLGPVCIHKRHRTAMIVKVKVIFLGKEENAKAVKEIVLLKKQLICRLIFLEAPLQAM
jgi:hypothetical protein